MPGHSDFVLRGPERAGRPPGLREHVLELLDVRHFTSVGVFRRRLAVPDERGPGVVRSHIHHTLTASGLHHLRDYFGRHLLWGIFAVRAGPLALLLLRDFLRLRRPASLITEGPLVLQTAGHTTDTTADERPGGRRAEDADARPRRARGEW